VRSHATEDFWDEFRQLPGKIRQQAYKAYRTFSRDPFSFGLNFKEVNKKRHLWSARITRGYRALGIRDGEDITWVWIGPHAEYDKRLK
jgi:hypothetical protein